jgi:hypothetical protein
MAKGDDSRVRNRIDQQGGLAQNHLDNLRNDMIIPQAQSMWNNYQNAADLGFKDYGNLMSGYENFQKTGGYSPQDIGMIRQRMTSPIRSIYANANREVDRGKALSGYSPNFNATKAKMAREASYAMGDATNNAEASIAQLVNQGKQFGLQGGTGLYGQAPGMASTFGNQALGATRNWLDTQQLQQNLGLGLINAQQQSAQLPGKWDYTMGRIGQIGNIVGGIAGIPYGNISNIFGNGGLKAPANPIGPMGEGQY